jgi:hypothetical protein
MKSKKYRFWASNVFTCNEKQVLAFESRRVEGYQIREKPVVISQLRK